VPKADIPVEHPRDLRVVRSCNIVLTDRPFDLSASSTVLRLPFSKRPKLVRSQSATDADVYPDADVYHDLLAICLRHEGV
jgi:hypothetical protein